MAPYVPALPLAELPPGTVKVVELQGRRIAVCNVEGAVHALEDRCSHDDGPLGEGMLVGGYLECPRHGAQFDVTTGRPVTLPAVLPVTRFPVKIEGTHILVDVP